MQKTIFGDKTDYIIEKADTDRYVVYSAYSNHLIALNEAGLNGFQKLLGYAGSGNLNGKLAFELNDEDQVLLSVLNDHNILFHNETDWANANFSNQYCEDNNKLPHRAYLHLTQSCNLACKYCYDKENIGKHKALSTDMWSGIISDLSDKRFDCLVFTGGECMLRKDIVELSSLVKDKEMQLHILSNGTIPFPKSILENADRIEVSLDSVNRLNNNRLRQNSLYHDVIHNLILIPEKYRNKIIIKTVLSVENEMDVDEVVSFAEKQGFSDCIITHMQPYERNQRMIYSSKNTHLKKHTHNPKDIRRCNACFEIIAVNSDGDIYPCHALIKPEFKICSILEQDWMEQVIKSKEYFHFKSNHVNRTYCKTCNSKYICGGMCGAISYNLNKKLGCPSESYCNYARKNVRDYLRSVSFGGAV